jgi:thioredoxin 1
MVAVAPNTLELAEALAMKEIGDDDFGTATAKGTVLVDFYATWCPPCKVLSPILEKLSKEMKGITFVKVNVDDHMTNASRLSIGSLPTIVLFKDGEEIKRHLGAMPEPALRTWLKV